MGQPELIHALQTWHQRAATLRAAGVEDKHWQQLAQDDINKVSAGGTMRPEAEVINALKAQLAGRSNIGDKQQPTNLSAIPGNVASDVGGIITGFIPGLAHQIKNLPGDVVGFGKTLTSADEQHKRGFEYAASGDNPLTVLAKAARNVTRTPLLGSWLPGAHTVANATTAKGRRSMAQHPVGTALDVLPAASKLGKIATAGRVAEAGSAAEALQQGSPVKAAIRAVPTFGRREQLAQFAKNIGLHPEITEGLARPYAVMKRQAQRQAMKLIDGTLKPIFDGLDETERAQLYEEAVNYNPADTTISPEHHAILNKVRDINELYFRQGEHTGKGSEGTLVKVPTEHGNETYALDSPVVEAHKKLEHAQNLHASASNKLSWAKGRLEQAIAKAQDNVGKVKKFGERPEDFAARAEHPISVESVHDAAKPLIELFRDGDPRAVLREITDKIAAGDVKTKTANIVGEDIRRLMGEEQGNVPGQNRTGGLFAKFDEAMASKDLKTARETATEIAGIFKHSAWEGFRTGQTLRSFMVDIREELKGLSGKERAHSFAQKRLAAEIKRYQSAEMRMSRAKQLMTDRSATFHDALLNNPSARWHPKIAELARNKMIDEAKKLYQGHELDTAINVINHTPRFQDMKAMMGGDGELFDAIMKDSITSWLDLAQQGYDPIWMHHVDPSAYDRVAVARVLPDHYLTPGELKDKVFNFRPGAHDIAAGVTAAGVDYISQAATKQFVNEYIMRFARPAADVHRELLDAMSHDKISAVSSLGGEVMKQMQKDYVPFDPSKYGIGSYVKASDKEMVLPKGIDRSLNMMMKDYKLPLSGAYDKTMHLYKFSVLTGPRHLAHVGIGGLTMAMIREPRTLLHLREAAQMLKEGKIPVELDQGLYDLSTDNIYHFAAGKSMARMFMESVGDKAKALAQFEEHIATIERTATMLSAEARGLDREAALHAALKVYIDMDGMSPLERTVIRNVFPFYAFTRHIMRYLFTLPVDHPVRAAILARYGEQEQRDWTNGLPRKFQQLFFLGHQNKKGNVLAVDYKSINPFRSIANDFTLSGFVSSLNPLITGVMGAAGVNTLSATPELYPALTYDNTTGTFSAKRHDVGVKFAEGIVPELAVVDHFIGVTDQMRRLKKASPDAYRRQLFSNLNIPFAWGSINVPFTQEKAEINRYKAAQTAESSAEKTGDWNEAKRFARVPSTELGGIVDPHVAEQELMKMFEMLRKAGLGGISPKALTPRRAFGKGKKVQTIQTPPAALSDQSTGLS